MPGAASCQPAAVAVPPARFRASVDLNAPNTAIPDAPVPLGLPPPRVAFKSTRKAPEASKASYDAGSSSSHAQHSASDTAPATNRCQVPAGASQQQQKAPSLMELVNAAARKDERQEALVRAGICASPRIGSSSRGASPRGAPFFSPFGPSSDHVSCRHSASPRGHTASASRPPVARSPRGQHSSGSASSTPRSPAAPGHSRSSASPRASPTAAVTKGAAVGASKPPLSPMAGATASRHSNSVSLCAQHSSSSSSRSAAPAPAGQQQLAQATLAPCASSPRAAPAQQPSGFAAAAGAAAAASGPGISSSSSRHAPLLPAMHSAPAAIGSDCTSDDGCLTPESSLCSSASSSSLCSYGSLTSSICSNGSRPKSILVRRSVSSSGASSPRGPRHVRWRDGESVREDAGADLVAVLLLQDTAEIRRLRKDTWPERSKKDHDDITVTIPTPKSSCSSGDNAGRAAGEDGPAAAGNPLVATVNATVKDWKEKLRALSAERRAQRVAEMQDTWAARQAAQQRQVQQRQQNEQAAAAAAAAAAAETVSSAAAVLAAAEEAVKPATAGPVITLQAVAGSMSQPVC